MNTTHRTHSLSLTLAGLAAAALALPATQGTATAASLRPPPQAIAQQTQNGLTVTDLKDLAKMKRDLFQRPAQQTQNGLTVTDLKDLAKMKRDLFQRLLEHSPKA